MKENQLHRLQLTSTSEKQDGEVTTLFPRCFPSRLVFPTARGESPKEETCNILRVQNVCCGLRAAPVVILRNCVLPTVMKSSSAIVQRPVLGELQRLRLYYL